MLGKDLLAHCDAGVVKPRKWLNRDSLGEVGGINLYDYVDNNPVNRIDTDGLFKTGLFIRSGIGAGGWQRLQ
jgi:uncharacterized protein RhaS with RHS repeats